MRIPSGLRTRKISRAASQGCGTCSNTCVQSTESKDWSRKGRCSLLQAILASEGIGGKSAVMYSLTMGSNQALYGALPQPRSNNLPRAYRDADRISFQRGATTK